MLTSNALEVQKFVGFLHYHLYFHLNICFLDIFGIKIDLEGRQILSFDTVTGIFFECKMFSKFV